MPHTIKFASLYVDVLRDATGGRISQTSATPSAGVLRNATDCRTKQHRYATPQTNVLRNVAGCCIMPAMPPARVRVAGRQLTEQVVQQKQEAARRNERHTPRSITSTTFLSTWDGTKTDADSRCLQVHSPLLLNSRQFVVKKVTWPESLT